MIGEFESFWSFLFFPIKLVCLKSFFASIWSEQKNMMNCFPLPFTEHFYGSPSDDVGEISLTVVTCGEPICSQRSHLKHLRAWCWISQIDYARMRREWGENVSVRDWSDQLPNDLFLHLKEEEGSSDPIQIYWPVLVIMNLLSSWSNWLIISGVGWERRCYKKGSKRSLICALCLCETQKSLTIKCALVSVSIYKRMSNDFSQKKGQWTNKTHFNQKRREKIMTD